MRILIIATLENGKLNADFDALLHAATLVNGVIDVLLNCDNHAPALNQCNNYAQINKIILGLNQGKLVEHISIPIAKLIIDNNYTHVLAATDSFTKNLIPRIAGILDLAQISEVIEILSPNRFKRFIYAGNVLVELESYETIKLLTIRTSNFKQYKFKHNKQNQVSAKIIEIKLYQNEKNLNNKLLLNHTGSDHLQQDLTTAKIVVAGGKSLATKENFIRLIHALADKYCAAIGATRAATEEGFAPHEYQVGQTGKIIAPELYLAIGISGAVQHIAGMKDAHTVIAINNDPHAPIFEYADYGLVEDLFVTIPQLLIE